MKIGVVGSMQFTEKMLEIKEELVKLGHDAFVTNLATPFVGKSDTEKEEIKIHQKNNQDAMKEFWHLMQDAEAILVANYDKHDITGYIGGNTFLEMGFAYILDQKIFLISPVPDMPYYRTEIEAMKPIVIDGDLEKIG